MPEAWGMPRRVRFGRGIIVCDNACGMDRIVFRSIPAMMLPWSRPSPGFPAGSRLRSRPQKVGVQDLAPGKKKQDQRAILLFWKEICSGYLFFL